MNNKFKVGDIVQYVDSRFSNQAWVKANLKFKVKDINYETIVVESLQDISTALGGAAVSKGQIIYDLEIFKFKLLPKRNNHLPKWF